MLLKRFERIERVQHLVYAGNYWLLSGVSIHSSDDWWLVLQAGSAARPIKTELSLLGDAGHLISITLINTRMCPGYPL